MLPPLYFPIQHLLLAGMFFLFILSVFNHRYAVLGYLFIMLARPGQVYEFLGSIRFELLSVIYIVVLIIVKGKAHRAFPGFHKINKSFLFFAAVIVISVIQAFNIAYSWDYAYRISFLIFAFYIMVICLIETPQDIKIFIFVYFVIVIWLAYMPIFNHFMGIGSFRHNAGIVHSKGIVSGVEGHVGLANLMTQSIPFAYFLLIQEKKRRNQLFLIFALITFTLATIASGSRGGFLGLIICGSLFWYKAKKKGIATFAIFALIILALGLNPSYLNWVSTILEFGDSDISAHSRIVGLRHGIEMAAKRPILGVGIGCYPLARKEWFHWGIWAHNHYGELIGELGLVGVLSWALIIYLCFKEIIKIKNFIKNNPNIDPFYQTLIDACWATLILRLIIGMTTHSLMAFMWYMIAGILLITSKSIEKGYPVLNQNGERY